MSNHIQGGSCLHSMPQGLMLLNTVCCTKETWICSSSSSSSRRNGLFLEVLVIPEFLINFIVREGGGHQLMCGVRYVWGLWPF